MIKRFTTWATEQRWAVVVSIIAALPSLILFVQQQVADNGGRWDLLTLIPAVAGFIIQRRVWSQRSVDELKA